MGVHFFFKRLIKILLLSIIIFFIISIFLIETTLQPILRDVYEADISGMLTEVINNAINSETNTVNYNNLIRIQTNRQGQIILMQPNLQAVNDLSSNITLAIQEALNNLENRRISIPIFQIFGVEVLSKYSPKINAQVIPYGAVKANIIDEFESVGINQTRHKIYLEIDTNVRVVVPLTGTEINVNTEVPLTEAVIVGQVPEVYVGVEKGLFDQELLKSKR